MGFVLCCFCKDLGSLRHMCNHLGKAILSLLCMWCLHRRPNQPPLSLEGARSLQAMLADQLKDDDEAVDAYVAGLCAYMDSPSRVRVHTVLSFLQH